MNCFTLIFDAQHPIMTAWLLVFFFFLHMYFQINDKHKYSQTFVDVPCRQLHPQVFFNVPPDWMVTVCWIGFKSWLWPLCTSCPVVFHDIMQWWEKKKPMEMYHFCKIYTLWFSGWGEWQREGWAVFFFCVFFNLNKQKRNTDSWKWHFYLKPIVKYLKIVFLFLLM